MLLALGFLALAIERIIELFFGEIFNQIEKLSAYKWTLIYISFAVGVLSSFVFELDLMVELGYESTVLGTVITGIALGGGSNVIHDLISGIKK